MLIMKLAVLSCAFYLGITFLADLAFFVVTLSKDGSGMLIHLVGMGKWSGALVSTSSQQQTRSAAYPQVSQISEVIFVCTRYQVFLPTSYTQPVLSRR